MPCVQIVSPALVERARHFGSTLSLKDEWKCIDRDYFNAPGETGGHGTGAASFVPSAKNPVQK